MKTINKQAASAFIVNMFAVHKGSSLIMAEIETGIVRLRKIRDDIPYDLINDKVNAKAKEIYEGSPGMSYGGIYKALFAGLYNKACAGEPMPWELKQTIKRGNNVNKR